MDRPRWDKPQIVTVAAASISPHRRRQGSQGEGPQQHRSAAAKIAARTSSIFDGNQYCGCGMRWP